MAESVNVARASLRNAWIKVAASPPPLSPLSEQQQQQLTRKIARSPGSDSSPHGSSCSWPRRTRPPKAPPGSSCCGGSQLALSNASPPLAAAAAAAASVAAASVAAASVAAVAAQVNLAFRTCMRLGRRDGAKEDLFKDGHHLAGLKGSVCGVGFGGRVLLAVKAEEERFELILGTVKELALRRLRAEDIEVHAPVPVIVVHGGGEDGAVVRGELGARKAKRLPTAPCMQHRVACTDEARDVLCVRRRFEIEDIAQPPRTSLERICV